MDLMKKLEILTQGAKYDAACTSSGVDRKGQTERCGICHSFAADGRCISLLKVLLTNKCIYDCKYCVNRRSNDIERTAFTPAELAEITLQFYRRNYIEGLFLSSGVVKSPDFTMELLIRTLKILRYEHNFWGYIHAKTIPGASPALVQELGLVADRLSVNIELPSEASLTTLAPQKSKSAILAPMAQIRESVIQNKNELTVYKNAPTFAAAGQATQMIIGATPETDLQIVRLASSLYKKYNLRRVFYSAYIPTIEDTLLPAKATPPPLLREHRLYQADFMLRFYEFRPDEILSESAPNFNPYLDPKCNWAINNMHLFPVDVNRAHKHELLRVPGIGPRSVERILAARRMAKLGMAELKRIGVVLKRARYFITAADLPTGLDLGRQTTARALIDPGVFAFGKEQLSLYDENITCLPASAAPSLPGGESSFSPFHNAVEEAALCLANRL